MVMNRGDRSLVVVGAFMIVATLSFILLFAAATHRSLSQRRTELWIELATAEGLKKGDAVLLRGVQVGEVKKIAFATEGSVLVRATLTQRVPLTSAAGARLVAADMFGRQTIVLTERDGGRALASGDTVRGTAPVSLTGRIEGLATRIERVVGDTTVDAVRDLLQEAGLMLAALESALHTTQSVLAAQEAPLQATLQHASATAANLRAATDSSALIGMRENASGTLSHLQAVAARMDTAAAALTRTMTRVEAGQGSLGLLATDPELYRRTVATLDSFDALLQDLRRNPKRYINVSVF